MMTCVHLKKTKETSGSRVINIVTNIYYFNSQQLRGSGGEGKSVLYLLSIICFHNVTYPSYSEQSEKHLPKYFCGIRAKMVINSTPKV